MTFLDIPYSYQSSDLVSHRLCRRSHLVSSVLISRKKEAAPAPKITQNAMPCYKLVKSEKCAKLRTRELVLEYVIHQTGSEWLRADRDHLSVPRNDVDRCS